MHPIVQKLLEKRGISESEQEQFLHPDFGRDIHDGRLMKGMDVAVTRLVKAIADKEKIGIFGDYDADGVPATALVARSLRGLGVDPIAVIPTRASGYGLNDGAVQDLIARGIEILITVDNGTVSEPEIATLKAAGIDTIVCDHHQPQEGHLATSALAILNPKQDDCQYPFKELCGCGLAWKLMVELYKELGKDWQPLKWELDLVAFSTIADMVPLLGENRVLASFGLQVARKSRNIGLRALAGVAGIDLEKISAGSIGFQLAPRINAPSRMHGELEKGLHVALSLLTTTDKDEADRLATYLNGMNGERQSLLTRHLQEAELQAAELKDDLCLVLYDENWSSGVIGLVAGRMLEKYSRPTVVLALEGEVIKGSVRSLGSLHAVELMASAEDLLERYGGHGKAGGLTVKKGVDAIQLRSTLNQWAASQGWELAAMLLAARKEADLELPLSEANLGLVEELSALEPFGIGFPGPLFEATCTLEAVRRVGKEQQHLSCFLVDGSTRRKAIAFSQGDTDVVDGQLYKVFYTLEAEEWNGVRSASCQIRRIEAA